MQSCDNKTRAKSTGESKKDSISIFLDKSYNKELTKDQKLSALNKAYSRIIRQKKDSIKLKQLSSIAFRFYQLGNVDLFFKSNKKALNLALKRKDSFYIGDAHWSYGEHYIDTEEYEKAFYHYNAGFNYFNTLKKQHETAMMLYSLSFIKARYKDFNGSEVLTFEAIKKFKALENYKYLFRCYNRLAIIQNDIKENMS